jgi:hypothetical protein
MLVYTTILLLTAPIALQTDGEKTPHPVDRKLQQAFGEKCPEVQWPLRLWLPQKGIAFAASDFSIQKDRVCFEHFSVAFFEDNKNAGEQPHIVSVRCDAAFITFYKPVAEISDLAKREVVKVEMEGKRPSIRIFYNRGRAEKNQGLDISITNGRLIYERDGNRLSTDGVVSVKDWHATSPIEMRGTGMEMTFAKPAAGRFLGRVERLVLRTEAEAHLVEEKSEFLAHTLQAISPPPKKGRISIRTGGMFAYDVAKQTAYFESPRDNNKARNATIAPDNVFVERFLEGADKSIGLNQLVCDRLDLELRRTEKVLEIKAAKATAQAGSDVVLSAGQAAYGNFYSFDGSDGKQGGRTILKGTPLRAVRNGNKLACKELHLSGTNKTESNSATWIGPGQMDFIDRDNPQLRYTKVLRWRDKLIVDEVVEGKKVFEVLKASGAAVLIDDQNQQEVRGEQLEIRRLMNPQSRSR